MMPIHAIARMRDRMRDWLAPTEQPPNIATAEDYKGRGNFHFAQNEFEAAATLYRNAIELRPTYAEAHNNLGLALSHLGRIDEALNCFRAALALNPNLVEAHLNAGNLHRRLGDVAAALACFSAALAIDPERTEVLNSLGLLRQEQGQLDEACACFHKALALRPDYAEVHNNLGTTYRILGRVSDAAAAFTRALALRSDLPEAHNNLGTIAQDRGLLKEACGHYRRALALKPDYAEALSNALLAVQYDIEYQATAVLAAHLEFADRFEKPLQATWPRHRNSRDPDRQLHVGFVSGDLRTHPVAFFLEAVLARIDRQALKLALYPTNGSVDAVSQHLQRVADAWRPLAGLSDDAAAQTITADRIDILVDLSGHTADNRLLVFARKPAPIQVSWLYFSTTGLRSMDYLLCDRHVVPAGDEEFYTEKPWHLPNSYLCFTPPAEDISVGRLPGEDNGYITFGCFNNLTKMNDAVVRCWAKTLEAVPNSRLFLKSKQLGDSAMRSATVERFANQGIAPERLILEGPSNRRDYLASYGRVDIALDPFPFPGGTTTVESLWMGVPVLGRRGSRFIARASESILTTAGLPDWIADDDRDFVAKATSFCRDLGSLAALRASLRERLLASPLCDAERFARNMEAAFRAMWRDFCAGADDGGHRQYSTELKP